LETEEAEEVSSGQCSVCREEKETALRGRIALPGIEEVASSSYFPITHHK
jgi:hypothetical protein